MPSFAPFLEHSAGGGLVSSGFEVEQLIRCTRPSVSAPTTKTHPRADALPQIHVGCSGGRISPIQHAARNPKHYPIWIRLTVEEGGSAWCRGYGSMDPSELGVFPGCHISGLYIAMWLEARGVLEVPLF